MIDKYNKIFIYMESCGFPLYKYQIDGVKWMLDRVPRACSKIKFRFTIKKRIINRPNQAERFENERCLK